MERRRMKTRGVEVDAQSPREVWHKVPLLVPPCLLFGWIFFVLAFFSSGVNEKAKANFLRVVNCLSACPILRQWDATKS